MGEYYFDVETYSLSEKPNPKNDKIITIQYQKLSTERGEPEDGLQILTEWDYGSEKAMLDVFRKIFLTGRDFDFIPIGVNLYGYDLIALISRLNHHFGLNVDMSFFRNRPVIDLKPTLIMLNKGIIKGYNTHLGKTESGAKVKEWYAAKDYPSIINYINDETGNFINKYQILKREIPRITLRSPV